MRVEKKCEERRSVSRERKSREGVRVERRDLRRSASREGVRVEKEWE